ncbi:signal peptidase I [Candidatus Dojkabacteria bacterium]|nr:signal peptidase I [Candidatus Dojkabacteria bacterium]
MNNLQKVKVNKSLLLVGIFLPVGLMILLVLGGLLFLGLNMFGTNEVVGSSMDPTFKDGSYVLSMNSLRKNFNRGDIVTYYNKGKLYIGRVVGLPGEKIQFADGILMIDGEEENEDMYADSDPDFGKAFLESDFGDCSFGYELSDNEFLISGDNREVSLKSVVQKNAIRGKVFLCYANCT